MTIVRGSYVANITPMTPEQELDEKGLWSNIDRYVKKGAVGICCAGGVLMNIPYYCRPSADESYSHFRAISDAVDIPTGFLRYGRSGL